MGTYRKTRFSGSDVHIYEFNQRKEEPRIEIGIMGKLEPLSRLGSPKAGEIITAKINATFFDVKSKSEILGLHARGWTQAIYGKDTVLRFFDPPTWNARSPLEDNALWTLPGSYTLMEDGKINIHNTAAFPHYIEDNPRTILGQRQNLNILFIVVQGRRIGQSGMTAKEEADLCKSLGLWNAVNLDGGGSSELIVGGKIKNIPTDGGERAIGAALVAYGRK